MKILAVLACYVALCLAHRPRPCSSPPLLSGAFVVSTQNEYLWTYATYEYDALGQRIRLREYGMYQNKSFTYDALLLYKESAMYEIDEAKHTCKKKPLTTDFTFLEIPKTASLLGQAVLGSSSGPGQGLLVNTWVGDLPEKKGKFMSTFTEFGCIPVSISYQTSEYGWVSISYFNNVIGLSDPSLLNPPDFCPAAEMNTAEEPVNFLSLFLKRRGSEDVSRTVFNANV